MRAYRFRLATVARIRRLEERLAEERLKVAQLHLRRAGVLARAADAALAALAAPEGVVTTSDLVWTGDQAARLAEAAREARARATAAEAACRRAQVDWTGARRRSGVLERLDEHGRAEWREATARQEAAELDDLSQARHRLVGGRP